MTTTPYLERQVFSPQATAGRGIRSTVGQRFYGGLSKNATPTPTPMPVQKPLEAMYAPEPMPMVNPQLFSGDAGEATPIEPGRGLEIMHGFQPQLNFIQAAQEGKKGKAVQGFLGLSSPFGMAKATVVDPLVQAYQYYSQQKVNKANLLAPSTTMSSKAPGSEPGGSETPAVGKGFGGYEPGATGAALGASPVEAPPTSGLADMGFADAGLGGSAGTAGIGMGGDPGAGDPGIGAHW